MNSVGLIVKTPDGHSTYYTQPELARAARALFTAQRRKGDKLTNRQVECTEGGGARLTITVRHADGWSENYSEVLR